MFTAVFRERNRVTLVCGRSRTKQSFKEECDINRIMRKFEKTGMIEHANRFEGQYGNFIGAPMFHEAQTMIAQAQEMFMTVPAKVRERFGNDPGAFLAFVQDENNKDEMRKLGLLRPEKHSKAVAPAAEQPALDAAVEAAPDSST